MEPEDTVCDGGLWLRTWRRTRPAPSTASSAPASSYGSRSNAHAHPGPLPRPPSTRPPVSRTARPSQQPQAGRLPTCARAPLPSFRPAPAPRPLGATARAPGWPARAPPPGLPPPLPLPSNQVGRRARSLGTRRPLPAAQRPRLSRAGDNGRSEFRTFALRNTGRLPASPVLRLRPRRPLPCFPAGE